MMDGNTFYGLAIAEFLGNLDEILKKGDRVEIMPIKDGIRITHIKRRTVYEKKETRWNE